MPGFLPELNQAGPNIAMKQDATGAQLQPGDIDPTQLTPAQRATATQLVPRENAGFLPPPTQASPSQPQGSGDDDFESAMGESSPKTGRQVGLLGRGAVSGLAGTADMLLSSPILTWVKHELGLPEDTYEEAANKALDKIGLPKANSVGERALQTTGNVISSTLATGGFSPEVKAGQLGAANYNTLASTKGLVNQDVVGALVGRELGLPEANAKLSREAVNAAGKQIRSFLDVVRDPERVLLTDPAETAGKIAALNRQFTPTSSAFAEHPIVKDLTDAVDSGQTNAAALGEISAAMGREASKVRSTQYQLSQALTQAQAHVESIVKSGLTPQVQQSYDQALKRYGLFTEVRDTALNGTTGKIDTAKLVNYFKSVDPLGYSEGVNTKPLYQVLRQSEGMAGNPLEATAPIHTKTLAVARAAAATIPGGAQFVMQHGIKPALRALVNFPGFTAELGKALGSSEGGDDGSSQ